MLLTKVLLAETFEIKRRHSRRPSKVLRGSKYLMNQSFRVINISLHENPGSTYFLQENQATRLALPNWRDFEERGAGRVFRLLPILSLAYLMMWLIK